MHITIKINSSLIYVQLFSVSSTETQMTDIVSSTSSSHPEQHTDEVKHTSDGATDTSQTDSDGENSNGPLQCGGKDRNPEPPPELLKERILDADNIGGTVFSKHWLFTTLMKLIQVRAEEIHTWSLNYSGVS